MEQTIEGMVRIREAVRTGRESVEELGQRGEQIGRIVDVINEIADQTNLLALNAAIEAARAGEHGRGFAVVAEEVRRLADRTTSATEEIVRSISAIQDDTTRAVEKMIEGSQQVDDGVNRATDAGRSLDTIVSNVRNVATMIQSIATASEEQSSTTAVVGQSVESIAAFSRQAKEGTHQAAEAATELSAKAEHLFELIRQFQLDAPQGPGKACVDQGAQAARAA